METRVPVVFKKAKKKSRGEAPLEQRLAAKTKAHRKRLAKRKLQKASRRRNKR